MMGVLNMMKAISRIREGETWQVGENMAGASPVTTIYGTGMWSRLTMFSTIRGYLAGQGAGVTGQGQGAGVTGQGQGGRHDRGREGGMTGASPVTTIYGTYIGSRWAVFSMN